jgi:hypothetical protein
MDNDTPRPGSAPPRGRPGPTIDLEATEVTRGSDANAKPHAGAPQTEARVPLWVRLWQRWRTLAADWPRRDLPWPLIAAAVGGAAIVLVIVLLVGLFSSRGPARDAFAARLAAAEQKIQEFSTRPFPEAADPQAVEALAGRVARLEQNLTAPRPPVTDPALANRIAALEGGLKSLDERIGVMARLGDDVGSIARDARQRAEAAAAALEALKPGSPGAAPAASSAALDALSTRIAALEAELAKRGTAEAPDRSARRATAADLLKGAAERGEPFAPELTAAKSLARDPKLLAPLEPFAVAGVPTVAALAQALAGLAPAIIKAAGGPPREGSFLERLQNNAGKLVRIRPADEPPGDDADAIVARAETRARAGEFASAFSELAKLPPATRGPAQAWIAKAQAREAALAASRQFAADALAALSER